MEKTRLMISRQCQEAVCLDQLLQEMILPASSTKPLVVANIGCSSTLETVNNTLCILRSRFRTRNMPEIMVCFNDSPSYDFNALFKLLNSKPKTYFLSAIPGSVYSRLLPRSYVNVFVCTNTLHWLSEVPSTVMDANSPADKRKQSLFHESTKPVVEYRKQAMKDMRLLLEARAAELVSGGLLYCSYESASEGNKSQQDEWLGPQSEDSDTTSWTVYRAMEHVWDELIAEGILGESQSDFTGLPIYRRTKVDVNQILDEYSHLFHVQKFVVIDQVDSRPDQLKEENIETVGSVRSMFGPVLASHLGTELAELVFARFKAKFGDQSPVRRSWLPPSAHALVLVRR